MSTLLDILCHEIAEGRVGDDVLLLTSTHCEIWSTVYKKPELQRVFQEDLSTESDPRATLDETIFVRSLILHLAASFRAKKYGMALEESGISGDIRQFFSKPIPRAVWKTVREYQEPDFIAFVDSALE